MVEGVPGVVDLGVAAGGVSIGLPAPLLGVTEELTAGVSPCCWACRVCPQMWWCFSQSLCWQNEPQYRAVLQPLQVSLALRPQFQQLSLESSCWLITARASSAACRLASATVRSIFARSEVIMSCAFRSASDTAFCSSVIAWRFTSLTASSVCPAGQTRQENSSLLARDLG